MKKTEETKVLSCLNLSQRFLQILRARGIEGDDSINKFLTPSPEYMINPFDIEGMSEAVQRINQAIQNKESVLIYGDYDCDGICAITILYKTLIDKVSSLHYFVPDRNNDGYGMSVAVLEKILAKHKVDLIITVDCGITAVNEVEFLKARGIDTIITDHHEPQDELPDCIIVNPKVKRTTFYEFCGAGVALKLSEALTDRKSALQYVDIAAIATIADIVPLVSENRIIASLGIEKMKKHPSLAIKELISENVNAYEIMYKVAPRINAAGRMDTAMKAVEMFLSDDYFIVHRIAEDLSRDNVQRQKKCDEVVSDCEKMLSGSRFDDLNFIVLASENWEAGILGIAASRLVEKFNRPTLLFAEKDGVLKGSCRSINGINVFSVLKKFDSHYLSFGGHSLAAGLSIMKGEFDTVKKLLNRELAYLDKSVFYDKICYDTDLDITEPLIDFATELEKLEPTGFGNPKPVFRLSADGLKFSRLGRTDHIKAKVGNNEIIGFYKLNEIFMAECNSHFIVNLSKSCFQNEVFAQLVIRDVFVEDMNLSDDKLNLAAINALSSGRADEYDGKIIDSQKESKITETSVTNAFKTEILRKLDVEKDELKKYDIYDCIKKTDVIDCGDFGNLFVAFSNVGLELIQNNVKDEKRLLIGIGEKASNSPQNQIIICPNSDFEYSAFNKVYFFEVPVGQSLFKSASETDTYLYDKASIQRLPSVTREKLLGVFSCLKMKNGMKITPKTESEIIIKAGVNKFEFFAAMQIFQELNLISYNEKGIINIANVKTSLEKSPTYRTLKEINV